MHAAQRLAIKHEAPLGLAQRLGGPLLQHRLEGQHIQALEGVMQRRDGGQPSPREAQRLLHLGRLQLPPLHTGVQAPRACQHGRSSEGQQGWQGIAPPMAERTSGTRAKAASRLGPSSSVFIPLVYQALSIIE